MYRRKMCALDSRLGSEIRHADLQTMICIFWILACTVYCTLELIDVISVNRCMCKCTVVGTVTTFSIGRRTDVNGGAGSGFSMMISHGQSCSCTGR